jgi:hypothetical protein
VGLRGAQEDVDLLEALAPAERVLEPLLVRDQHGDRDVAGRADGVEHLLGVRELGDHVRAHEARDLEALEAGAGELVDQPHLLVGGDRLRLVLEAVAGADLADAHARGSHGR